VPEKPGHIDSAKNRSATPILTRGRDPDANQELIRYDDIRFGSIAMRQGPMEPDSSLLFGVASRLRAGSPSHSMRVALPSIRRGSGYASS
jgi:hypothetical protein